MTIRFDNQVAIVTGAGNGLGKSHALELAKLGAKVVVNDFGGARDGSGGSSEAAEQVVAEIKAAGGDAIANGADVSDEAQVETMVKQAIDTWGRIDVLVPNAAITPVYGPMQDLDDAVFDKMLVTNVRTINTMCKMVLPQMAEKGEGAVVLLSSIAGLRGNTVIGTYGVSKAAEAALARNLAVEWGPKGIRINSIAPGLIKTDFAKALWDDPERAKQAEDKTPLRRIGDPVDIAGLAVFLSTKASAYITGQVIVADGGETIC